MVILENLGIRAIEIEDLPIIDFIVISHNHYDHLDKLTIKTLYERQPNHSPKI